MKRSWEEIEAQYMRLKDTRVPAPPSVSLQTWLDDVGTLLAQIRRKEQPSLRDTMRAFDGPGAAEKC